MTRFVFTLPSFLRMQAFGLVTKAQEAHCKGADVALSSFHRNGWGTAKSEARAMALIEPLMPEDAQAVFEYAQMAQKMGITMNPAKEQEIFKAADAGKPIFQAIAGRIYLDRREAVSMSVSTL